MPQYPPDSFHRKTPGPVKNKLLKAHDFAAFEHIPRLVAGSLNTGPILLLLT